MNNFEEKRHQGYESELKLHYCGKRIKNVGHAFGPYRGNTYLLYYIKEGTATLSANGKMAEMSAPGFFVNFPHSESTYVAGKSSFWSIKWIVVEGGPVEELLASLGITRQTPFAKLADSGEVESVFDEMYEWFDKTDIASELGCISLIYKLFSVLARKISFLQFQNEYVVKAMDMIGREFHDPEFNVSALASRLELHYNYFSVLFKRETGISPQKAISDCRIQNACKMLKYTNNSVRDIASACGFSDEFYFSRKFRKAMNISPTEYRKQGEVIS